MNRYRDSRKERGEKRDSEGLRSGCEREETK